MNAVGYLIGSGSMTLGVEQAGFTIDKVLETPGYSKNAQSWDLNRPDNKHQVLELNSESELPGCSGLDLIYGNPPCGGMSHMTGCKADSETNLLMIQWARMVVKSRPRMVLMENAYQITTNSGRPIRDELINIFQSAGYTAWTWRISSWQVGCPQARERAFLCATLETIKKPELLELDDLPQEPSKSFSCMDWLWDLTNITPSEKPVKSEMGHWVTRHWWDNLGRQITEMLPQYFDIATKVKFMTDRQANKLLESGNEKDLKTYHDNVAKGLYWKDAPQIFQSMQIFRRPHRIYLYGPCPTVLSDFRLVHPVVPRLLTMREQARLMGYPDDWLFHECKAHLTAQGVPTFNSKWGATRLLELTGYLDPLQR